MRNTCLAANTDKKNTFHNDGTDLAEILAALISPLYVKT